MFNISPMFKSFRFVSSTEEHRQSAHFFRSLIQNTVLSILIIWVRRSMANDVKRRVDCGAGAVDRITNLPRNLIDLILERLPLHDAARTTILSKAWRNIWDMLPHLVFDDVFFSQLVSEKVGQSRQFEISTTISHILLLHTGPVLKFHLSIPHDLPLPYTDLWIKTISRSGTRILKLFNEPRAAYKVPSYLFSCSELTHLNLYNCILNPPLKFGGFCNLMSVTLMKVTITEDVLFGTQLETLDLKFCTGIEHLGSQFKYYKNLKKLVIFDCGEIDWRWFECTKMVEILCLTLEFSDSMNKIINLDKLLGNMPGISYLTLNGFFLKRLELGTPVPKRLITVMGNLKNVHLSSVEFCDLVQIQYVLCLIRSSPNLQNLCIRPDRFGNYRGGTSSRVEQYLESPNLVDMVLEQLEIVDIRGIVGSTSELHFIKLLLASSPSLRWMKLSNDKPIDDRKEELRISRELMRFPRASRTAQIIWT